MILQTGKKILGFSLIELLVVIGIIILVLGISTPYFVKFAKKSKLEAAAGNIATVLRSARTYAITNNTNYAVHFDRFVVPNQYWITDSLNNIIGKKYNLPPHIDIYNPNNPSDPITFDSDIAEFSSKGTLTGGTSGAVWISLAPEHIKFKRIVVYSATGFVKIDETP